MDKKDKLLSLIDELSNRLDMEPDAQDVWELVEYMNCDGRLRFYNKDTAIDIDFVDGDIRHKVSPYLKILRYRWYTLLT